MRLLVLAIRDWEGAKLGALFLLTFPGTPYIYYGSEIGLGSSTESSDAGKRSHMDWDAAISQSAQTKLFTQHASRASGYSQEV